MGLAVLALLLRGRVRVVRLGGLAKRRLLPLRVRERSLERLPVTRLPGLAVAPALGGVVVVFAHRGWSLAGSPDPGLTAVGRRHPDSISARPLVRDPDYAPFWAILWVP